MNSKKTLALSLYTAMGGSGYSFCRVLFPLPTVTLTLMLSKVKITAGLSSFIMDHLTNTALIMSENE